MEIKNGDRKLMPRNCEFLVTSESSCFRKLFWGILICLATFYSIFTIVDHFERYYQKPTSMLTETELQSELQMVQIWACLNSQHSKWKLQKYFEDYPELENYISTFYGNYFDSPKDFNVSVFDDLDLGEFFLSTRPEVVILRCQINMQKCPQPTQVLTRYGWCSFYRFNAPEWKVTIPGPQSSFIFYAAYNKTDTTTGTLQFVDGMTVFYGDSAKEDVMVEARSTFALPNRLTQIALYPHQNTYLPENCGREKLDFFPFYTRENCLEECRYKNIIKKCKCVPPYLPNYKDFPPCQFGTHAMCISPSFMLYNFTECSSCPRECVESVFTRNVEYGKYHEPIYRTLARYSVSQGRHGIDIAAFQIFFPQLVITKRHQRNEYNLSQFFSELGGSTGLVLGISFLSIIRFMDDCFSVVSHRIRAKLRRAFCRCWFRKNPDRPRTRSVQTQLFNNFLQPLPIRGSIPQQTTKESPLQNL